MAKRAKGTGAKKPTRKATAKKKGRATATRGATSRAKRGTKGGSLKTYKQKRRFGVTPEPGPVVTKTDSGRLYIIQKHDASHLHYDFRLEHDGVLKSWAVPKGPSLDPADKSLAVEVEDHPVAYGSFEGIIPQGEYGGGTVMLWDRGTWEPEGDVDEGLRSGMLKFTLKGEKLRGRWMLVRMSPRAGERRNNWLLRKESDDAARTGAKADVRVTRSESVATGRTMEEIEGDRDRVWGRPESRKKRTGKGNGQRVAVAPGKRRTSVAGAGVARPFPTKPGVELATLFDEAPQGDDWVHEVKFDGYRVLAKVRGGQATLMTRRGNDWTAQFRPVAEAMGKLKAKEAVLDGEVVVLNEEGKSDFQALQKTLKGGGSPLHYFVFDLLYFNGRDLTGLPLLTRKHALRQLLQGMPARSAVQYSEHIVGGGSRVHTDACRLSLEGIISKKADSLYVGRRTTDWRKVKCGNRQEFVIGGYSEPEGSRVGFGALLLGVYHKGTLRYCGRVGTGFSNASLRGMLTRMKRLEVKKPAFVDPPRGAEARGVHWLKPELVGEVKFAEWTGDGHLRHPAFEALREDKDASQVVRERLVHDRKDLDEPGEADVPTKKVSKKARVPGGRAPASSKGTASRKTGGRPGFAAEAADDGSVAGVALTNPGRVLYPEQGVTKLDLARYYEAVAAWVLPHLKGRPISMVRCPQGREKKCFFQKHLKDQLPKGAHAVPIREKNGVEDYVVIDTLGGLVSLVQMGVLEVHLWGCTEKDIERPDRIVMDLDPGPGVEWGQVVEGAVRLRQKLESLGLQSFVKTTGGKGLHVVVPIAPGPGWDAVKAFTKVLADSIVAEGPEQYIATMSKAQRTGKIFIDYLRNGRGATAIAPYSTRSRENATVATPVSWEELEAGINPQGFTVRTLPERVKALGEDPWARLLNMRQKLNLGGAR